MKKIVIQVDPDLSDLIPGFIARKRSDAQTILAAADRADYELLSQIGHKMKGEGGSYGLDAITDLGAALERAAKAHDRETARRSGDELIAYLDSIEIIFE